MPAKKAGEIIARHHDELRFCHESQQATPDQVQVQLKFIVSPRGDVQTASIDQSNAQSDAFDRCITAAARRWTFPAPKGGASPSSATPCSSRETIRGPRIIRRPNFPIPSPRVS